MPRSASCASELSTGRGIGLSTLSPQPGGRVTVDLAALRENYLRISARVASARAGAVLKADAYGLGVASVAPVLAKAGCRDFFVALLQEARSLKPLLPSDARIHVLNGLAPGEEGLCARDGFLPVLNSAPQARRWRDEAIARGARLPATLQLDSGMSRLGMAAADVDAVCADPLFAEAVEVRLLMTHLACADTADDPTNAAQLQAFRRLQARFEPGVPWSIANSAGSFLDPLFHGDLVRPGLALFGAGASSWAAELRPVVRLEARIIQLRDVEAGVAVGYGHAFRTKRASRIATLGVGYADGWPRRDGGHAAAWLAGRRLPIVGRVSMDSMTADVTDVPAEELMEGDHVELIGPRADLAAVAAATGVIPYEILTGLSRRLEWIYEEANPSSRSVA